MIQKFDNNYKSGLQQIKQMMAEGLALLPKKEQKKVNKDIYFCADSASDYTYAGSFKMFYQGQTNEAVKLVITKKQYIEVSTYHNDLCKTNAEGFVENTFKGDVHNFYQELTRA